MIPRLYPPGARADERVTEVLTRPPSNTQLLTACTVVAHWSDLAFFVEPDELRTWTADQWAEHLDEPTWQQPFIMDPDRERCVIWHAGVRLHPDDRALTGPEWAEIAHRLARAAGIEVPGDDRGCRWVAFQSQLGHLDLLANLIRQDDRWNRLPPRIGRLLQAECRHIERDFDLIAPATTRFRTGSIADTMQIGQLLTWLADESTSPVASARVLIEHAAHRLESSAHASDAALGHQLDLLARRLHKIQHDVAATAAVLPTAARTLTVTTAPATTTSPRAPRTR
ncbi:relaxase/mobilization nuclease [Actinacidiphila sp. bgisy144]|uniref:relaxase/mobilization nuclease n=1 Tax=Actinacidiphila sp. bgisy144 TaxID=3413791 RepID=UPI003EBD88F5